MKVLVSDNLSQKGIDILKKAGLDVDVKTGWLLRHRCILQQFLTQEYYGNTL